MQANWQDPPAGQGRPQIAMPGLTPVVKALILANVGMFAVSFLAYLFSEQYELWLAVRDSLGLAPETWVTWFPFVPVWQLVTYGFLHDTTNAMHIVVNMLFLYFLGTMLEGIIGGRRFLVLYGVAIVVAGLSMLLLGLATRDPRPTIGASGAVLAVVVATAVLRPNLRVIFIVFPITLKTMALIYVGMDVFGALSSLKGGGGGVAYLAHLTGAGWGFLAARRGWIWRDPIQGLEDWRGRRAAERAADDARLLDELLEKIHRDGIHSLSTREKAFLKRTSKRP